MTRVRLPPDPENHCLTTIVDSQGGDQALIGAMQSSGDFNSSDSFNELLKSVGGPDSSSPTRPSAASTKPPLPLSGMEHVDCIVLVYALDKQETFYRLESHWLPLIERCYSGELPVIIAGNKMDTFQIGSSHHPTAGTSVLMDEQTLARSRQQIVSLMQRFRFVRQCIKCSAKNLVRIDEVFLKAQQSVLYPFSPLYDLVAGQITPKCQKAFGRIFRIYDQDHDGLLSNVELDTFQYQTFHVPLVERDLTGWKKVVNKHNPTPTEKVIQDGKFTVPGFLAIFDVFISQNRLDVPWRVLRRFGYDDDLNLQIPEKVTSAQQQDGWRLSTSARQFLAALFHQFDSDSDGLLSPEDVGEIFKIVPDPALPPWHPVRGESIFYGCYSIPKESMPTTHPPAVGSSFPGSPNSDEQQLGSASFLGTSGITIISGAGPDAAAPPSTPHQPTGSMDMMSDDSFPMMTRPLNYLEWMSHWHTISAIAPEATRAELFRLGHIETRGKSKGKAKRRSARRKATAAAALSPASSPKLGAQDSASTTSSTAAPDWTLPSYEIRVLMLGSKGCGKSSLVRMLSGDADDGSSSSGDATTATGATPTSRPVSSSAFVKMKRKVADMSSKKKSDEAEELVVHLIFTEVPESEDHMKDLASLLAGTSKSNTCFFDLVVLGFDCGKDDDASFSYARKMEKELLTDEVRRVFVGTKCDGLTSKSQVIAVAREHCEELDLEPPLLSSSAVTDNKEQQRQRTERAEEMLIHLCQCTRVATGVEPLKKSKPHEEQKRMEAARRRKMIWLGGLVSVSVAVAVGVGVLWTGMAGKAAADNGRRTAGSGFGWLSSILGFGGRGGSATATAEASSGATAVK